MLPSAPRVVVADSGPLISLGRLNLLHLLAEIFEQVQVPHAVLDTLGVLMVTKRRGLVPAVTPLIERLRASGQWLNHEAVHSALAAAGEAG